MSNQGNYEASRVFAAAFASSLAKSLTVAAELPWQLKVLDNTDLSTRQGQAIHFRVTLDSGLGGEFFVEFYEPQVVELASKISGLPAADYGDEHRDALGKIISSAMVGLAESRSDEYGKLTTFKVEQVPSLAFGGMYVVPLVASSEEQPSVSVALYFDGQLLAALSSLSASKDAADAEKSPIDPVNLKLVMDVELNVALRFGQRQLPLREVLELTSGSVIELDRQVDDPVELLLDGKVIARGEAVIVDGNYGLRITEVPLPIASHFIR